jgi:protein-tyrosine phosphatase
VNDIAATLLATHRHRHVALEGARNVRDLGGLAAADGRRTRHGVVFRADTLAHLSDADMVRLAGLGLRTVVDLRTASERARAPDRLPAASIALRTPGFLPRGNLEMIAAVNAGTFSAADALDAMCEQYRLLALEHLEVYREILDGLCEDQATPLLFHCASGKDRTGVTAAIVLLAVGVAPALVREDYVISNFQRRPVDLFSDGAQTAAVDQVMAADPRYLDAALAAINDSYGAFDAYLAQGLGLDDRRRAKLAARLLD